MGQPRLVRVDTSRIVLAGHSMGGWVTALTASHDHAIRGAILICPANMGGATNRANAIEVMRDNMESLAGVTAESMADEVIANHDAFNWDRAVPGLARVPLLILTADDGLAPDATKLANAIRAAGNARVTVTHVATDHSWSDRRIELESLVIRWLEKLR